MRFFAGRAAGNNSSLHGGERPEVSPHATHGTNEGARLSLGNFRISLPFGFRPLASQQYSLTEVQIYSITSRGSGLSPGRGPAGWILMKIPPLFALCAAAVAFSGGAGRAQTPPLTPDIPAKFNAPSDRFDFTKREVMIPMRDGVKLHTVIVVPRGAKGAPILLTRAPYNASKRAEHNGA